MARAGWKPVWGASDSDRGVPAAPVSWSLLWTLGSGPLWIWDRRGLRLHVDQGRVRGRALRGAHPAHQLSGAGIVRRWFGLRWACCVETPGGTGTIASAWASDEDVDTAHILAITARINQLLSIREA